MKQVDADFKLKDMKKLCKEMEMKGKGYHKKLDDLQNALKKHMEQYDMPYSSNYLLKTLEFIGHVDFVRSLQNSKRFC